MGYHSVIQSKEISCPTLTVKTLESRPLTQGLKMTTGSLKIVARLRSAV